MDHAARAQCVLGNPARKPNALLGSHAREPNVFQETPGASPGIGDADTPACAGGFLPQGIPTLSAFESRERERADRTRC